MKKLLLLFAFLPALSLVVNATGDNYTTIEWDQLLPQEDLEALQAPPDYINEIEDGSAEDQIASQIGSASDGQPPADRYQQALVSSSIVKEFDNRKVRLPGFLVPLEFDDNHVVTEFFLVPYFGACLHTPPPPPNQIVFVKHEGFKLERLSQPFWVSGLLSTAGETNELAHAAYSMQAQDIIIYGN